MTLAASPDPMLAMSLVIEAGWPGWLVAAAGCLIVVYVWWTYRATMRRLRWAIVLACLRGIGLLALLTLVLRPVLLIPRKYMEKPMLAVVLDVSASMARQDQSSLEQQLPEASLSRLEAAVVRLTQDHSSLLRRLADRFDLQLAAFSDRVLSRLTVADRDDVSAAAEWLRSLRPDGSATDLAGSVREVLATLPDKPLAGLVLVSDGRGTVGEPLGDTVETMVSAGCTAIAVVAGSDRPMPDVRIRSVKAAERAFVGEPVVVEVSLQAVGLEAPADVQITLSSEPDARTLAERSVTFNPSKRTKQATSEIELRFRPDRPGTWPLRVAAAVVGGEANLQNNEASLLLEAVSARIRVLYVDGYPRYEYRYLKNLLLREPTVISSCLLLSADPEFPQEGDEPIRQFPRSLEQLDRYDVVLIGDVDPEDDWLERQALRSLAEWVVRRGGGIGWIAGTTFGPQVWRGTPLEPILPVRLSGATTEVAPAGPYRLLLTELGQRSALFRLCRISHEPSVRTQSTKVSRVTRRQDTSRQAASGTPEDGLITTDAAPMQRVIDRLAEWYWCASVGPANPAADVLAVHPRWRTPDGHVPVVVIGHYGGGRTFFCGSDDVWRWRRYKGIEYYNAFWLQVIRWLAGPRKLGAYRPMVLEVSPRRIPVGEPLGLTLRIRDSRLVADLPNRIYATIRSQDKAAIRVLTLRRLGAGAVYTGSVSLQRAGRYTVRVEPAVADQPEITADLDVFLPESETADVPADRHAMQQWANLVRRMGSDGYVLDVTDLEELEALPLARPSVRTEAVSIRLWDNIFALLFVGVLLLSEWALRRARGLA